MNFDEIKRIADISKLKLSENELKIIAEDFNDTIEMIRKVESVDVKGFEPTVHVHEYSDILRDDIVEIGLKQADAIKNTLETQYGFIKLIKFVE